MTVHLLVVALALFAVAFAARFPSDSNAISGNTLPTFVFSGITSSSATQATATYFRPGASNQTRVSITALTTVSDVASVRSAGAVSPISSFSSGVASAAAASGEQGAGVKPLADVIDPREPFVLYETLPGDTTSGIAAKFGIALRTLLDNNPTVGGGNLIALGQQLVVPRKDGILYKVGFGDTVETIVGQYDNITASTVIDYKPNAIADPKTLRQGEFLLLPGATVKPPPPPPPPPPAPKPVPIAPGSSSGGSTSSGTAPLPGGVGKFRFPLAGWRSVSDAFGSSRGGGTYHTGIDLDLYGYHHSQIFSACDGVVSRTEFLTYSYGYHVIVDCGDGWSTLYAHMSEIKVNPGQRVSAGSVLGISGVTGFTTGEHLHFEIRKNNVPVDPSAYLPF